jgi:Fur family ferric uptake transcriptional regulator
MNPGDDRKGMDAAQHSMTARLEQLCHDKGLKMTEQRRVIARVLSDSSDHPDVEQVHRRAVQLDPRISIATVYRTVKLFEEAGIIQRHDFGTDGRARYEEASEQHHDHLIDVNGGEVIEFVEPEIERLQQEVARRLGYRLVGHKMELYGVKLSGARPQKAPPATGGVVAATERKG